MAAQEVRYCTTSDGVRIAYCVEGEGPPLLMCTNFIESFSVAHYFPQYEDFWRKIAEHHQLIRFDMRGTGLSQRNLERYSLAGICMDMEAVVAAARLKKFAIWASGAGGVYAIRYAASHSRSVERLIIYGSFLRATDALSADTLRAYATLWRANPEVAAQTMADYGTRHRHSEAFAQVTRTFRESVHGEDAARLLEDSLDPAWNAEDSLSLVSARTLVMHRRDDATFPFAAGQAIAAGIKNARFLPLQGDIHDYALEDSAAVLDATLAFLAEGARKPRPAKPTERQPGALNSLRTVLFTDIVGHTEMMQRLGDAKGRDVLREHERITRETLKAHGGAEVKTMGDGFMASFGSRHVGDGVRDRTAARVRRTHRIDAGAAARARRPQRRRADRGRRRPLRRDRDPRVAHRGEGRRGRDPGSGAGARVSVWQGVQLFRDRGEFEMKGFDDAVRLYEVRWQA